MEKFCQSCSMPLEDKVLGKNADGSKNAFYCIYCYENGKFTDPDITMDQMIDKCAEIMSKMEKMNIEEAKSILEKSIPNLKRWQK